MKHPKVTVLLPVYNGEAYLKEAIESILDQSFRDFELLIVNDASTDDSLRVAQSFTDSRIRIISNKKNLNLLNTLNVGLKQALGEYVARMDQDDISNPHRLAIQVQFLDTRPDIGVVGTGFQLIDQHGYKDATVRFASSQQSVRWSLCFFCPLAHPTVMMRKDLINSIGGYSSKDLGKRGNHPSEDYDLWRRASKITMLANIPRVLLLLRKHHTNLTTLYLNEHLKDARLISRLAIEEIMGARVPQSTVDLLWMKRYMNEHDVQKVVQLIINLYHAYEKRDGLTPKDRRFIRRDACKRLLNLAVLPQAGVIRKSIMKEALHIGTWTNAILVPLISVRTILIKGS